VGQAVSASTVEKCHPGVTLAVHRVPGPDKHLHYGTAGFRDDASLLSSTLLRVGMLAALRSRKTGLAVGIVVTASHNAACDNGVKLVDPSGGMLDRSWEAAAEELANAPPQRVTAVLAALCAREGIVLPGEAQYRCWPQQQRRNSTTDVSSVSFREPSDSTSKGPVVLIARDTRSSGESLAALAAEGVRLLGGTPLDRGLLTTPQVN
jgi:phosphoacetylglucosamine mutase